MAGIDDKIDELNFSVATALSVEQIAQAVEDAGEVGGAGGEKVTLTRSSEHRIDGVARNFVRVQHAVFSVVIEPLIDGSNQVTLTIDDYLRTRETLLIFIPVSPWGAPAFRTLKAFSEYLRSRLS
ncbi:MAG: hypothetical protein IPL36_13690 [Nigerium sp.]|nr:hypothetical protein [Nigerium sp.]